MAALEALRSLGSQDRQKAGVAAAAVVVVTEVVVEVATVGVAVAADRE